MKLDKIIAIADKAYGDGLVGFAHRTGEHPGDTLATFIAVELRETYDPKATGAEQLAEAVRTMRTALDELREVVTALETVQEAT